jgi:hypothetical protein
MAASQLSMSSSVSVSSMLEREDLRDAGALRMHLALISTLLSSSAWKYSINCVSVDELVDVQDNKITDPNLNRVCDIVPQFGGPILAKI